MHIVHTDRSRIETYQRCARLRWLEYHEASTGIASAKKPLPLAVGGSVHKGLETLLRDAMTHYEIADGETVYLDKDSEERAVAAALAGFATHRSALAVDTAEAAAMAVAPVDSFDAQVSAQAKELGLDAGDPQIAELFQRQRNAAAEFEGWLYAEQAALVEGLVRAYARRRLRPLLEEYEVLEVEREGEWELASWDEYEDETFGHEFENVYDPEDAVVECRLCHYRMTQDDTPSKSCPSGSTKRSLMFMSRPDALLRSRADNSLYLLSFKTAASWDVRKARDAEHDMQGLSEGVEVERRLGEWWQAAREHPYTDGHIFLVNSDGEVSKTMHAYLASLPAPPRILGIRYEYMLKGSRYADKDLASRFGLNVWAQRSHLIRAYHDSAADRWCWSYEFLKDDGSASKLYYKSWRPCAVWESMTMRQWVDMLDTATEAMSAYDSTTGAEPRSLGWHSDAQAQGFTATHPLDDVFVPPLLVYRQDDDLRDWIEETEAQEREVAEHVALVAATTDEGEKRHLLNTYFRRTRKACEYPSTCGMSKVCWGGDDIRSAPLDSGLYRQRVPNHPQERSAAEAAGEPETR